MKKILLILFFAILGCSKCHVTLRDKNWAITTNSSSENENNTEKIWSQIKKNNKFNFTRTDAIENFVYLEDVLYAVKNHNWSTDERCLNETLHLIDSLRNFTLWAVWEWDSISSEPQGLLFGNRYQLGNFDECLNAPWSTTHPELQTQYCLADIELESPRKHIRKHYEIFDPYQSALGFIQHRPINTRPLNELTWGICVPAVCSPRSVEQLLKIALARSHLGVAGMRARISVSETCQSAKDSREYDGLFYGFMCLFGFLTITALVCTYLDNTRQDRNTLKSDIIEAFCLKKNIKNFLKVKKEGIEVFYGIRFLTICFIVMDHTIGIFNSGPISNGLEVDQDINSSIGMFILHDDLFVDTFFLLSGFLTATNFTKFKRFPNPFVIILKRYISLYVIIIGTLTEWLEDHRLCFLRPLNGKKRLVVALALVIFYICAVFPHTGSGPLWPRAISADTDPCLKNWWLNLLMVSNYVNNEHICMATSWYIPCDFHFFVIAAVLYWTFRRQRILALSCAGVLTVAAILAPGIINYVNELPAIQLFTYDFIIDPRSSKQFQLTYIKSHTRFAAYLVGFYSGYLFAHFKAKGNLKVISKKWSVLCTVMGMVIMLVAMITGTTFLWRDYHPLEGAVYAALNRPAWACGVAFIVMSCSLGYVPFVKAFLSWYPWVPLSRLAYGLYLTHTIFITRNVFVTRNPEHNDYFELLNASAGFIFWGCLAALIIWLLGEAPANNLLALCLRHRVNQTKELDTQRDPAEITADHVTEVATSSNGYLQDNLPTTVMFSSKV